MPDANDQLHMSTIFNSYDRAVNILKQVEHKEERSPESSLNEDSTIYDIVTKVLIVKKKTTNYIH